MTYEDVLAPLPEAIRCLRAIDPDYGSHVDVFRSIKHGIALGADRSEPEREMMRADMELAVRAFQDETLSNDAAALRLHFLGGVGTSGTFEDRVTIAADVILHCLLVCQVERPGPEQRPLVAFLEAISCYFLVRSRIWTDTEVLLDALIQLFRAARRMALIGNRIYPDMLDECFPEGRWTTWPGFRYWLDEQIRTCRWGCAFPAVMHVKEIACVSETVSGFADSLPDIPGNTLKQRAHTVLLVLQRRFEALSPHFDFR